MEEFETESESDQSSSDDSDSPDTISIPAANKQKRSTYRGVVRGRSAAAAPIVQHPTELRKEASPVPCGNFDALYSSSDSDSEVDISRDMFVARSSVFEPRVHNRKKFVPEFDQPKTPTRSIDPGIAWKQIYYDHKIHVDFPDDMDLTGLKSLVGMIPVSTWTNILSSDQREELKKLLPELGGWKGMESNEALVENLRLLLNGENFDFGNPVDRLSHEVLAGIRTKEGATERKSALTKQYRCYMHQRQREALSLIRDIRAKRSAYVKKECPPNEYASSADDSANELIESNVEGGSVKEYVTMCQKLRGKVVEKESSLFVGIMVALQEECKTPTSILQYLKEKLPQMLPDSDKHYAVEMDELEYLTAALNFLVKPLVGTTMVKSLSSSKTVWESPCVTYDPEKYEYSWNFSLHENSPHTMDQLTMLEQVFSIPTKDRLLVRPRLRTAAAAARKRMIRHLEAKVHDAIQGSKIVKAAKRVKLSRKCYVGGRSDSLYQGELSNRDQFREQEKRRYANPGDAFAYITGATSTLGSTVGPLLQQTMYLGEDEVLVPYRPPEVTMLNLVRDAACRLPGMCGTRVDIRCLLQQSQYLRLSVSTESLDRVIASALDTLHYMPDPCVHYHADTSKWVYLHASRTVDSFAEIAKNMSVAGRKRSRDMAKHAVSVLSTQQTNNSANRSTIKTPVVSCFSAGQHNTDSGSDKGPSKILFQNVTIPTTPMECSVKAGSEPCVESQEQKWKHRNSNGSEESDSE